jgi:GNAT superfamily N-acetyltransferase
VQLEDHNMELPAADTSLKCLPRSFAGKNGAAVELHRLPPESGDRLIDMYLAFQPRNSFQGLPPIKDAVCIKWVREMLDTGIHITAESAEKGLMQLPEKACHRETPPHCNEGGLDSGKNSTINPLIGHAAIFPVNRQKCEMLVVVCPGFQNLGIGTELVRSCIELAEELGFEQIWLPVDSTNVRARHVYRKCGFEYVSNKLGRELDMTCDVRRSRIATVEVGPIAVSSVRAPQFHRSSDHRLLLAGECS